MKRSVAGKRVQEESRPIHKFSACLPAWLHAYLSACWFVSTLTLALTLRGHAAHAQVTCSSQPIPIPAHLVCPLSSCSFRHLRIHLLQLTATETSKRGHNYGLQSIPGIHNATRHSRGRGRGGGRGWVGETYYETRPLLFGIFGITSACASQRLTQVEAAASHLLERDLLCPSSCLPCRYLSNSSLSSTYHISNISRLMPCPVCSSNFLYYLSAFK